MIYFSIFGRCAKVCAVVVVLNSNPNEGGHKLWFSVDCAVSRADTVLNRCRDVKHTFNNVTMGHALQRTLEFDADAESWAALLCDTILVWQLYLAEVQLIHRSLKVLSEQTFFSVISETVSYWHSNAWVQKKKFSTTAQMSYPGDVRQAHNYMNHDNFLVKRCSTFKQEIGYSRPWSFVALTSSLAISQM